MIRASKALCLPERLPTLVYHMTSMSPMRRITWCGRCEESRYAVADDKGWGVTPFCKICGKWMGASNRAEWLEGGGCIVYPEYSDNKIIPLTRVNWLQEKGHLSGWYVEGFRAARVHKLEFGEMADIDWPHKSRKEAT